ncbi:MAG: hypothetical protein H0W25_00595, partial [Acidimicrobiia bacterium]|nr:hypothetical protein [Acidimicrobiia bacterium]
LDRWRHRALDGPRLLGPGIASWAVGLLAAIGALALRPDLWPLQG